MEGLVWSPPFAALPAPSITPNWKFPQDWVVLCRQCWIWFDSGFYSVAAVQGALPGPVQGTSRAPGWNREKRRSSGCGERRLQQ